VKLIFTKDTDHQVTVVQEKNGKRETFSYVDMITDLLENGQLSPPELNGAFSDPERTSINRMIGLINNAIEPDTNEKLLKSS
jgi:hypothetical protein